MDLVAADGLSAHVVHDPARRADDDLRPIFQTPDLSGNVLAAVDGQHLDTVHVFGQIPDLSGYLDGQFPGGAKGNGLNFLVFRIDFLKQGNAESGGLAGAGLGLAHNVPAFHLHRNGLGLNRRRLFESHLLHRPENPAV